MIPSLNAEAQQLIDQNGGLYEWSDTCGKIAAASLGAAFGVGVVAPAMGTLITGIVGEGAACAIGTTINYVGTAGFALSTGNGVINTIQAFANGDVRGGVESLALTGIDVIGFFATSPGKTWCFPPETLVGTETGLRPIVTISAGERVWAFDFRAGEWRLCEVEARQDSIYEGSFVKLVVDGGEIKATAYHPFWVIEGYDLDERPTPRHLDKAEDRGGALKGRWVNSHDVRPGDVIYLRNGTTRQVLRTEQRLVETPVCNLTVRDLHSFAVGELQVLVHNVSDCGSSGRPRINKLQPDPDAVGPHTVFKRDPVTGEITGYQTYVPQTNPQNPNPWQPVIRVDVNPDGSPHFNKVTGEYVPTPHVHDPSVPGGVRPALPGELPGGGG